MPMPAKKKIALSDEAIRQRAYELWEKDHGPHGEDMKYWLLAEAELSAAPAPAKAAAPKKAPAKKAAAAKPAGK